MSRSTFILLLSFYAAFKNPSFSLGILLLELQIELSSSKKMLRCSILSLFKVCQLKVQRRGVDWGGYGPGVVLPGVTNFKRRV